MSENAAELELDQLIRTDARRGALNRSRSTLIFRVSLDGYRSWHHRSTALPVTVSTHCMRKSRQRWVTPPPQVARDLSGRYLSAALSPSRIVFRALNYSGKQF